MPATRIPTNDMLLHQKLDPTVALYDLVKLDPGTSTWVRATAGVVDGIVTTVNPPGVYAANMGTVIIDGHATLSSTHPGVNGDSLYQDGTSPRLLTTAAGGTEVGKRYKRTGNADEVYLTDGILLSIGSGGSFVETVTTFVDNGDGTYTYTSEDGTVTTTAVPGAETVTTLVDNGDGTFTYTSEDGTITTFNADSSTIVDNGDGTTTITTDDGNSVTIPNDLDTSVMTQVVTVGNTIANHDDGQGNVTDIVETVTTFVDNGDGTYTYTSEDGTITTTAVPGAETVTTLVDNGDGTFTYTSEDGTITTFDAKSSTIVDNGDGTSTVTTDDGNSIIVSNTPTAGNTSVLTQTVLAGNQIASHDDGTGNVTTILETITTFVDNGDGTYTYTSEDGTITTTAVPGAETVTTLIDNGNGTFTYTSENGTITTFDAKSSTIVDNGDGTSTITTDDGNSVIIPNDLDTSILTQTVLVGNQIAAHDDGTGNITPILETVTTFVDNGDGTYTYTSEDGTITTTAVPGAETVTTLVDNGNGTFTYTSESGTITTFDAKSSTIVDNGDGTSTITTDDGNSLIIPNDLDPSAVTNTALVGNLIATHDDGNGVLTNINETVTSISLTGTDIDYVDESGVTTTLDLSGIGGGDTSIVTDNADGTYTHNDGTGLTVTIDTRPDKCDGTPLLSTERVFDTGTIPSTTPPAVNAAKSDIATVAHKEIHVYNEGCEIKASAPVTSSVFDIVDRARTDNENLDAPTTTTVEVSDTIEFFSSDETIVVDNTGEVADVHGIDFRMRPTIFEIPQSTFTVANTTVANYDGQYQGEHHRVQGDYLIGNLPGVPYLAPAGYKRVVELTFHLNQWLEGGIASPAAMALSWTFYTYWKVNGVSRGEIRTISATDRQNIHSAETDTRNQWDATNSLVSAGIVNGYVEVAHDAAFVQTDPVVLYDNGYYEGLFTLIKT